MSRPSRGACPRSPPRHSAEAGIQPRKQKFEVKGGMRVRAYDVFHRAVEEGISLGWHRAHKHTDTPGEDAIKDHMLTEVLNSVSEYFVFEDPSDDG